GRGDRLRCQRCGASSEERRKIGDSEPDALSRSFRAALQCSAHGRGIHRALPETAVYIDGRWCGGPSVPVNATPVVEEQHYILAPSDLPAERDFVLKQNDSFALFDHFGDLDSNT